MKGSSTWILSEDRYFDPYPSHRNLALEIYENISNLPIISPHGHVDPHLFLEDNSGFGTPTDLLIIPDHYVFRMLFSQGIHLDQLGIKRKDGKSVEDDHRKIWQVFADHYHLFRGTPTSSWLDYELNLVLEINQKLTPKNALRIYDEIVEKLNSPEFKPRALYQRFNIELLSTTDSALDSLDAHKILHNSSWSSRIVPTFRPDQVINPNAPNWWQSIQMLGELTNVEINNLDKFILALEKRRADFIALGAKATDHGIQTPNFEYLTDQEAAQIFSQALKEKISSRDASRFTGHMLLEMARMSTEDGLVMQIHPGSFRNHCPDIFDLFGPDKGADIPVQTEFTSNLYPLLNKYGVDPRFSLILFTLDESTYSRELAPLAGFYPSIKLGPPWWFHDSWNGMQRYFDRVMETAGISNTAGFNDDTRAFLSIPARHDLWRRASANWLAGLSLRGFISKPEALDMAYDMAYQLPQKAYKL
jgi:glucuronate isomerase